MKEVCRSSGSNTWVLAVWELPPFGSSNFSECFTGESRPNGNWEHVYRLKWQYSMCFLKPTGLGFNVDANILGLLEDLSTENNFLGASGKERHLEVGCLDLQNFGSV